MPNAKPHMISEANRLDALLQSVAETLFPAEEVLPVITLKSADVMGDTPLHVFLWRKDDSAAQLLIQAGANVNAVGDMSETPIFVAVRNASIDTLVLLIQAGAKLDVVSEFGQTPLELARIIGRENDFEKAVCVAKGI